MWGIAARAGFGTGLSRGARCGPHPPEADKFTTSLHSGPLEGKKKKRRIGGNSFGGVGAINVPPYNAMKDRAGLG